MTEFNIMISFSYWHPRWMIGLSIMISFGYQDGSLGVYIVISYD
jgi:hypothetical protein